MITRILLVLIYVKNSITMSHLVVIRLMRVIKWPRSDSDGSCVNKKGRGYKGFYSISLHDSHLIFLEVIYRLRFLAYLLSPFISLTPTIEFLQTYSLGISTLVNYFVCIKLGFIVNGIY